MLPQRSSTRSLRLPPDAKREARRTASYPDVSLSMKIGTFSTDGFQDGYGELDRAGLGIQGAVRTKARENKNSLATKTIPDYGVNEIVGETRTQT